VFPVKNTRNILHPSVPATDRQRYQRPSRHVTAGAGSDGDRLQQLPAVSSHRSVIECTSERTASVRGVGYGRRETGRRGDDSPPTDQRTLL